MNEVLNEERETGRDSLGLSGEQKVVIHLDTGEIIKGRLRVNDHNGTPCFEDSLVDGSGAISVKPLDASGPLAIQPQNVKAIFVVRSFQGDPKRKDLRFYGNGPAVGNTWVEVQFKDGEIIEGFIENSVQHLLEAGFWLRPSDPRSNNTFIHVNKTAIVNFRVLGVKAAE